MWGPAFTPSALSRKQREEFPANTIRVRLVPSFAKAELSKLRYMIQVSGNRVRAARFPSFAKEGWLRHKKNGPVP